MNRIQLAAFKAELDEVGAWSDKYLSDAVAATLGLPVGVPGAWAPTGWDVVVISDQLGD